MDSLRFAFLTLEEKTGAIDLPKGGIRNLWLTILPLTAPDALQKAQSDKSDLSGGSILQTMPSLPTLLCLSSNNWGTPAEGAAALLRIATEYLKQGQVEEAANALSLSIHISKDVTAKTLINSARLFFKTELLLPALWCALYVIGRNPQDRDASRIVAESSNVLGSSERLKMLEIVQKVTGCSAIALSLTDCYFRNGDAASAKRALNKIKGGWRETAQFKWLSLELTRNWPSDAIRQESLSEVAFSPGANAELCLICGSELVKEEAFVLAENSLVKALSLDPCENIRRQVLTEFAKFPVVEVEHRGLPLILISQIQRSGGTLLSQLLDGHSQLLVHPHELHIGHPKKWNWPDLDLQKSSLDWLSDLFEIPLPNLVLNGYRKPDSNPFAAKETFPFHLSIAKLCSSFLKRFDGSSAQSQRQVLDAYFDAFFDNWEGQFPSHKKYYAGFTPRLLSNYGSVKRYLTDYQDGMLVVIIRDPYTWYASSKRHSQEYEDIKAAMELWRSSTLSALLQAKETPNHLHLMTYEGLVCNAQTEMQALAIRLGINFEASLLTPTFMGQPILPNSSFAIAETGIHRNSLDTSKLLSTEEHSYIESEVSELYEEIMKLTQAQTKSLLDSMINQLLRAIKIIK